MPLRRLTFRDVLYSLLVVFAILAFDTIVVVGLALMVRVFT